MGKENPPGFFAELKRRNVLRAGALYAASGWLLIQVATQVFPFFHIAEWIVRWIVVAATIGFPFALLFSWFYEWTPQGLQRESELPPDEPVTRLTGRKLDRWIIAILGLAVVLLLANQFVRRSDPGAKRPSRSAEKSIAVLPFENLSEDKANAYFTDGMQDEIITRLAKIGALKVISRSSTQRYRGQMENVAEIARQLGVAHLVEGSVQKVGERVRINVQLIDAQNDEHLWAELYDRSLTDIFSVQTELATRIADSLQATLSGSERQAVAEKPTANLEAYDAYLHGLVLFSRPGQTEENQRKAADSFAVATRLDPQFAQAWAVLAQADAALYFLQFDTSPTRREAARVAAETATRLNPTALETLLANAYYRYHVERDYEGARLLFEKIRRQVPNNAEALTALARIARRQSRWSESLRLYEAAAQLNPRDAYLCTDRAWTLSMLRQFTATAAMLERALEISPDDPEVLVSKAKLFFCTGDLPAARAVLARIPPGAAGGQADGIRVSQMLWEGNYEGAAQFLEKQIEKEKTDAPQDIPFSQLSLGDALSLGGKRAAAQEAYLAAKKGLEKMREEQPGSPFVAICLGFTEAGLGNKEAALREAHRATSLVPTSEDPVFGPGMEESLAAVEAQVGEIDRALERIERLLTTPYGAFPITLAALRLDPTWIPLRQHPRYPALLAGPEPKTIFK